MLEFDDADQLTPEYLVDRGKKLFFPKGKSEKGHMNDMSFHLAFYSGELIEAFKDVDGNTCTFTEYLKSHGKYASRCILYVVSTDVNKKLDSHVSTSARKKLKVEKNVALGLSESVEDEMEEANVGQETSHTRSSTLNVNTVDADRKLGMNLCVWHKDNKLENYQDITVQYTMSKESRYSKQMSYITFDTREKCKESLALSDAEVRDMDMSIFYPTDHGFCISRIEKGSTCFDNTTAGEDHQNNGILFGPNVLYGYEDHSLILGCVANFSGTSSTYTWYRNGKELPNKTQIVYVEKEGVYFCEVIDNNNKNKNFISEAVSVKELSKQAFQFTLKPPLLMNRRRMWTFCQLLPSPMTEKKY